MTHEIEGDEIPVSEAEVGDWAFPKPFKISKIDIRYDGGAAHPEYAYADSGMRGSLLNNVARVIRPREPWKVGGNAHWNGCDMVLKAIDPDTGCGWFMLSNGAYKTILLSDGHLRRAP